MPRIFDRACAAGLLGLAALLILPAIVEAHERRDVGAYQFVVGFIVEPAFEGLKNGVGLRVSKDGDPVEGVEQTLQVEITHVESGAVRTMDLRTLFNDPGHYTADLIPTAPGVYQMRLFGTIEGVDVDETFVSRGGGGDFSDIESTADIQFPERLPEVREIEGAVRGAQEAAAGAEDSASSARTLAIVGIVLGALGIASGAGATAAVLRRR